MNITSVIEHLRAHIPLFQNRIGGSAQFQILPEAANLLVPSAYVIPLDENPDENQTSNGYRQSVDDSFAVVVVLDNKFDERGQAATVSVHAVRQMLIQKLVGWAPDEDYDAIDYDGGSMLRMDRSRLYFQFEFKTRYEIDTGDTWFDVRNQQLPDFAGVDIKVDAIDVADPNHPKQDFPDDPNAYQGGTPGPDGRFEGGLKIDLPQT